MSFDINVKVDVSIPDIQLLAAVIGKLMQSPSSDSCGSCKCHTAEPAAPARSERAMQLRKMGGGVTLYYFKEMGEHAAPGYLKRRQKPLLILQGEKDFQATAVEDFAGYKTLLEGRENVSFKLYPGLNHAFVPALSDDINKARKEYAEGRHIGDEVIGDIARWILEN